VLGQARAWTRRTAREPFEPAAVRLKPSQRLTTTPAKTVTNVRTGPRGTFVTVFAGVDVPHPPAVESHGDALGGPKLHPSHGERRHRTHLEHRLPSGGRVDRPRRCEHEDR